jgi:hypothetical protein
MGKFKSILILTVFMLAFVMGGHAPALADQSRVVMVGGGQASKPLDDFVLESESPTVAGDSWYVDSGKSASGDGKSWDYAVITLNEAIDLAAASNGDVIHVAPGHAETIDAATDVVPDVAGITVIGYGEGRQRPTFSWADAAAATFPISGADFVLKNMVFDGSSTANDGPTAMFTVTAAGFKFINNEVIIADATEAAVLVITGSADADRMKIIGNRFYGTSAEVGCTSAITFTGTAEDIEIGFNTFEADFGEGAIDSDQAVTQLNIHNNYIWNYQNGDHAIQLDGNALGTIRNNHLVTDVYATSLDPGKCDVFETYWEDDGIDDGYMKSAFPEAIENIQWARLAYEMGSVPGSAVDVRFWFVDANIATSGDGKTPHGAFKTIQEAITASSNSYDDWIFVFDYSGGGATITMDKAFVHLIGNSSNGAMNYPRIMPASAVAGITFAATGDRVEIAHFVIGGGDQTVPAISFPIATAAGAYGVYIHDNVIGRDANAPALEGIYVVSGGAAPYLKVENNRFIGAAGSGIAAAGSAIRIAGNATRCQIIGNKILDVGRTATPAIWLDGAVTEPWIEGNQIKTDTDTGTGSAITLGASVDDGWISGNIANDGKNAPGNNPFVDGASTNGWGINYTGKDITLP